MFLAGHMPHLARIKPRPPARIERPRNAPWRPRVNLAGLEVGELVVVGEATDARRSRWRCRCSCGGYTVVQTNHLTSGAVLSCGHLRGLGEQWTWWLS